MTAVNSFLVVFGGRSGRNRISELRVVDTQVSVAAATVVFYYCLLARVPPAPSKHVVVVVVVAHVHFL
jgi:hypothetical protein